MREIAKMLVTLAQVLILPEINLTTFKTDKFVFVALSYTRKITIARSSSSLFKRKSFTPVCRGISREYRA